MCLIRNWANWSKCLTKSLRVRKLNRMLVAGSVAVVTTDSVPLSVVPQPQPQLQLLAKASLAGLAWELKRWFLPHLMGGIGLFLLLSYVTAGSLFSTWPVGFKWLGIVVLLTVYGAGAFVYSLFTACVFAVRAACVHWNDFIDGVLDLVQTHTAQHVADMNIGLSKPQARSLVRGSVREVFSSLSKEETAFPRLFLWVGLGTLALAVRAVLSAKISKWATRTVKLGKVFAGRATLAGAVFLNLHFFATVLLYACYAFGISVAVVNMCFIFLLQ